MRDVEKTINFEEIASLCPASTVQFDDAYGPDSAKVAATMECWRTTGGALGVRLDGAVEGCVLAQLLQEAGVDVGSDEWHRLKAQCVGAAAVASRTPAKP